VENTHNQYANSKQLSIIFGPESIDSLKSHEVQFQKIVFLILDV